MGRSQDGQNSRIHQEQTIRDKESSPPQDICLKMRINMGHRKTKQTTYRYPWQSSKILLERLEQGDEAPKEKAMTMKYLTRESET
jgi:hypothetical protein